LGSASWNEGGLVTWTKPDGKIGKYTVNQLKNMSIPRLELLLKHQGYYEKFPGADKNKLNEDFINPFQLINII